MSRMNAWRYQKAMRGYNDTPEKHAESLQQLTELLIDPVLPRMYRLMANLALADGTENWDLAETFRKDAEEMWQEIKGRTPDEDPTGEYDAQKEKLAETREALDSLAEDQLQSDPDNVNGWDEYVEKEKLKSKDDELPQSDVSKASDSQPRNLASAASSDIAAFSGNPMTSTPALDDSLPSTPPSSSALPTVDQPIVRADAPYVEHGSSPIITTQPSGDLMDTDYSLSTHPPTIGSSQLTAPDALPSSDMETDSQDTAATMTTAAGTIFRTSSMPSRPHESPVATRFGNEDADAPTTPTPATPRFGDHLTTELQPSPSATESRKRRGSDEDDVNQGAALGSPRKKQR
ncbi:hypothetical protein LTR95_008263 [Oleoguttula sp. CCFEE 5521]